MVRPLYARPDARPDVQGFRGVNSLGRGFSCAQRGSPQPAISGEVRRDGRTPTSATELPSSPVELPRRAPEEAARVESVTVTIELPVSAPLRSYVRALEAARDAQTDQRATQALAVVTALASRGLIITLAKSVKSAGLNEQ